MLRPESKTHLLRLAKSALESTLAQEPLAYPDLDSLPAELRVPGAVFVTLRVGQELRGCIGNLDWARPLAYEVMNTAIASANEDPRFPPLSSEELLRLTIEISVLSPLDRVPSADAITPERHGVLVQRGPRRGLFLPQVWKESGWDKKRFLDELCASKAGLPAEAWQDPATELYTFESESFSATVADLMNPAEPRVMPRSPFDL